MNANSFPQPGKNYTGGYDIHLEFENVLNLPERAKVVMDGTEVGVVTDVAVQTHQVDVTARIAPNVAVPSNIHAALQQATVLGDIYLTLDRPADQASSPALPAGAVIPLAQTTSPPQLEDTIAHMANFVSSGSVQRLQSTIVGLNRAVPPGDGAVRKLAAQAAADLGDMSKNIDTVDLWLDGLHGTSDVLHTRLPSAEYWFSTQGKVALDRAIYVGAVLVRLFPSAGSVYNGGYWLVPMLTSLANMTGALQQSKWAFEDEWPAWRDLFTDTFLPEDKNPAINITSIVGPDGRELSGGVADVLRILGAAP
ncbi:MCE family protein [Mycobacterium sp. CBMA293]|nr:MCE family protein [Mycolicibacterium sp. CBMA 360]MUL57234.1 MCE family protein [Mycolicibacterium sp. CBMA 335]MUL70274.1 MCE family protein [Mycolicibacterium sp. CBMA 311]MUL92322.1 MCE family protein [Mycolicibacterium sp. CBMA 230]MUM12595.1 MCE family protein [Mycolicibacterium sp. CBMA 293]MUM32309.1 MCE family protein [Mycolicibacterium sp. CBMA 361]